MTATARHRNCGKNRSGYSLTQNFDHVKLIMHNYFKIIHIVDIFSTLYNILWLRFTAGTDPLNPQHPGGR
jgi:hypothetical protein